MASLIPGYEYDIFISYRQKDNRGERWVSEFVESLKTELESTFKEEISVYFDINPHDGLLETHFVDDSLKDKLKSLLFIPIISRTYCDPNSYAWESEFKIFIEQAKKDQFGLKIKLHGGNVASRVLPVIIHDLDSADIKLCESMLEVALRGVEFIYKSTGVNRPLRSKEEKPHDNLNKTVYRDQINKVANAIKEIILGLKSVTEGPVMGLIPKKPAINGNIDKEKKLKIKTPRKENKRLFLIIGALSALIIAAIFIIPGFNRSLPDPTICVLLPNKERSDEGAFYQDGKVQFKGFEQAKKESDGLTNCLSVHYLYMNQNYTADTLMHLMRENYKKDGATYFVMTMSSKIEGIINHFKSWHDSCITKKLREPILIATVASAPGLADIKSGIVRWYIRSQEESTRLADYLRWKEDVENVGIFCITRTEGLADDTYGNAGKNAFQNQFASNSLKGRIVEVYHTTGRSAKKNVEEFNEIIRSEIEFNSKKYGAYIVGYGDMVKIVLEELISQNFSGSVACSSTLTEPDWQPKDRKMDNRIFTVLPKLKNPASKLAPDERNVVFYFSKETLKRVLEITSGDPNSGNFLGNWQKRPPASDQLEQEITAEGDCIIQLDVIGSDTWR